MINEKDLQAFVEQAQNGQNKSELKNLEKRMKRDVMSAIQDFNMIQE